MVHNESAIMCKYNKLYIIRIYNLSKVKDLHFERVSGVFTEIGGRCSHSCVL